MQTSGPALFAWGTLSIVSLLFVFRFLGSFAVLTNFHMFFAQNVEKCTFLLGDLYRCEDFGISRQANLLSLSDSFAFRAGQFLSIHLLH